MIIYVSKTATLHPENGLDVKLESSKPLSKRLARAFNSLPLGNYHVDLYGRWATICTMLGSESLIIKDVRVKNK